MTATKRIDAPTLDILSRCAVVGNNLVLPSGQLDRKAYEAVNKVLELMGGKWNRKSRVHVFAESPADLLDTVILTGEITDKKKLFQFFETPEALAARMVALARTGPGSRVLEPSAGRGRILRAIGNGPDKVAVEIDPENMGYLMRLGVSGLHINQGDFLECFPHGDRPFVLGLFDAAILNPPFSRRQAEKHIFHAREFLKPSGVLVAICPDGPRENATIRPLCQSWESLPAGTFAESGTQVSTALVVIEGRQ